MLNREKRLSPEIRRTLTRLALRMVPLPAAPELFDLLRDLRKSRSDLDQQVNEAMESLRRSSQLVSQLEEGLRDRSQKLDQMRVEYEKYSALAEISEKEAEAIIKQLQTMFATAGTRGRRFSITWGLVSGAIFFILGVFLSSPLQNWASKLWALLSGG